MAKSRELKLPVIAGGIAIVVIVIVGVVLGVLLPERSDEIAVEVVESLMQMNTDAIDDIDVELEELGLSEAFESAICLVEWPDKLGPLAPPSALTLTFATDPEHEETRHLTLAGADPKWSPLLEMLS